MGSSKITTVFVAVTILFVSYGCTEMLNEPVHSELAPENYLNTKTGLERTLGEGYSRAANMQGWGAQNPIKAEEMSTDLMTHSGGGEHRNASLVINFTWDANIGGGTLRWGQYWDAIRNANIVLDNVEEADIPDSDKDLLQAEARFVRVYSYYKLWNQFGPVPLRTSTLDELELPRATEEEFQSLIESELEALIQGMLPEPGNEPAYGRAHAGAARALLCKWYLNTKQWQKSADIALDIINNGNFSLYPDYNDMFALENERNNEFIWVRPAISNEFDARNTTTAVSLPWGFQTALDSEIAGLEFEGWANYASQYRMREDFYNSFDPDDERKNRILTRYIDDQGETVDLLQDFDDAIRGLKYPPDPNASGENHGNDIPDLRYADILLSRAEALNELNGPNQESIDLINMIRNRAGLDDVTLAEFGSQEDLRDHILRERGWEFWYESKRRRDLIRHDKFIEFAQERGVTNAAEHHKWFPIPQNAIDANPSLEQNSGY